MTLLFVSDLHLHPTRPAATACFLKFLAGPALSGRGLYILGDLFEAWIGDDSDDPHDGSVLQALAAYAATGRELYFLPGNRDFLVGPGFTARSGAALLDDETVITPGGRRLLLMHGDTLCTDDHAYQRYRRVVHSPFVRRGFLALPRAVRRRLAGYARSRSTAAGRYKAAAIMDVNAGAVAAATARHGASVLIHGHTHRPGVHEFTREGGGPALRIVLGDWYAEGSCLRWSADGFELLSLPFP